jgi:hypothetical protein
VPWRPDEWDAAHPERVIRRHLSQVVLAERGLQAVTDKAGAAVTEFRPSQHHELQAPGYEHLQDRRQRIRRDSEVPVDPARMNLERPDRDWLEVLSSLLFEADRREQRHLHSIGL